MPETLIDYECLAYRRQVANWRLIEDVYRGDSAWLDYRPDGSVAINQKTRRYLPQLPGEKFASYQDRVFKSHFSDKLAQAIRDFVGVVFNNGVRLVDVPDQILSHWQNLSGDGLTGSRLASQLALQSLRLGHTFCLVDWPTFDGSIVSLADSRAANRQPLWSPVSPLELINWRWVRRGGYQVLSSAVLRRSETLPQGDYGETSQTYYYRLLRNPARFDCYSIQRNRAGQRTQVFHPDKSGLYGRLVRGRLQPLEEIPLVCLYGGDRTGFYQSNPTLLSLAKLNIAHYQVRSDHRQKMHYCSFPTPVRVGGQGEDLVLGPRTIVDVPLGGSFGWAEPRSQSLAMSRVEIKDIESEMDFLSADYVVKPGDRQAALTSQISATKVESELYLFASDFAQGLTDCLTQHAHWLGLSSGGRAELDTKFFQTISNDPQLLLAYLNMHERELLSDDEVRRLASERKFFPDTFKFDGEDIDG